MKKIIIVIMTLLSLSLVGCSNNNLTRENERFTKIEEGPFTTITTVTNYVIMYDNETHVEYICLKGHNSGISPLYNADGTLKIYEEK